MNAFVERYGGKLLPPHVGQMTDYLIRRHLGVRVPRLRAVHIGAFLGGDPTMTTSNPEVLNDSRRLTAGR